MDGPAGDVIITIVIKTITIAIVTTTTAAISTIIAIVIVITSLNHYQESRI